MRPHRPRVFLAAGSTGLTKRSGFIRGVLASPDCRVILPTARDFEKGRADELG